MAKRKSVGSAQTRKRSTKTRARNTTAETAVITLTPNPRREEFRQQARGIRDLIRKIQPLDIDSLQQASRELDECFHIWSGSSVAFSCAEAIRELRAFCRFHHVAKQIPFERQDAIRFLDDFNQNLATIVESIAADVNLATQDLIENSDTAWDRLNLQAKKKDAKRGIEEDIAQRIAETDRLNETLQYFTSDAFRSMYQDILKLVGLLPSQFPEPEFGEAIRSIQEIVETLKPVALRSTQSQESEPVSVAIVTATATATSGMAGDARPGNKEGPNSPTAAYPRQNRRTTRPKVNWPSETTAPPSSHKCGPLIGNLKKLSRWIVRKENDDRTLLKKINNGTYWGRRLGATEFEIYFPTQELFAECNGRRLAEERLTAQQ